MFGVALKIKIKICHDKDANVYFALSDAIGLAVEANNLDRIMEEIRSALPVLLEAVGVARSRIKIDIRLQNYFYGKNQPISF